MARPLLSLLLLASVACADSTSPSAEKYGDNPTIRVEFWHAIGARTHQDLLLKFADEFHALHPEIRVEPLFQGTYGTMYQKLIAAVTSRHPPALAMMYESWTARLLGRGRLDPVQNYIDGPDGYSPDQLADFYPAYIENNRFGGRLVTMPFNKSAYMLVYNRRLLERAGFASPPRTWEDLRNAARAISRLKAEDGRPCRGLIMRPQLEAFLTLLMSGGGSLLGPDGNPSLQAPSASKTFDFVQSLLAEDGGAILDETYPANLFAAGNVGMYIYSSAAFPFNDRFIAGKFPWGTSSVPAPSIEAEPQRKTLFQGMNVGILMDHPPEVRAAAWKFLRFMLEPEQAARWSMLTAYCPVRRSAEARPEMQKYLHDHPNYAAAFAEADHAGFEPKEDFWEAWRPDLNAEIVSALQGVRTPKSALLRAQRGGEEARQYESKFDFNKPR